MGNNSSKENRVRQRPTQTLNFDSEADILTDSRNNLNACQDELKQCQDKLKQCTDKNKNIDRQLQKLLSKLEYKYADLNNPKFDSIISELDYFRQQTFSNTNHTTHHKHFTNIWRGGRRKRTRRNRFFKS